MELVESGGRLVPIQYVNWREYVGNKVVLTTKRTTRANYPLQIGTKGIISEVGANAKGFTYMVFETRLGYRCLVTPGMFKVRAAK